MSTRYFTTISLNIQFDNEFQSMQWNAPILLTQVVVTKADDGTPMYSPTQQLLPAVPSDITDELLTSLQQKLLSVGLTVSRIEQ